jgi:hypothetical protein
MEELTGEKPGVVLHGVPESSGWPNRPAPASCSLEDGLFHLGPRLNRRPTPQLT